MRRVAERDSQRVPAGELLVAEVDGEIRAALSLFSGEAVTDPFHPTVQVVELLRLRARQLSRPGQGTNRPWTAKRVLSPVVCASASEPPS